MVEPAEAPDADEVIPSAEAGAEEEANAKGVEAAAKERLAAAVAAALRAEV